MSQDVRGIHVKVSEEAAIAEKSGAFVTAPASPFRVVDAAEVAESGGWVCFGAHEVVDCCAEGGLGVCFGGGFGLEAHDFAGAGENLGAGVAGDDLGPCVGCSVFAGAAVEVAEETEIEVGALGAADMAIPDCCAAEVAGCDDSVGESD
jgi:hypothetical protein